METNHALVLRTYVRAALVLAALGGFQVAHAATADVPFTSFMQRVTGNSTTVGFSGSGAPVAARAPTALGGTSGWTYGSNFGVSAGTSGGYRLATAGDIAVGKNTVPVNLVGQASKAAAARSVAKTFMAIGRAGAGPIGLMLAVPAILDYLSPNGVGKNPDQSDPQKPFLLMARVDYTDYWVTPDLKSSSHQAACSSFASANKVTFASSSPGHCTTKSYNQVQGQWYEQQYGMNSGTTQGFQELPASLSDIEPYLVEEIAPAKLPSFIDETERFRRLYPDAGIEPFKLEMDQGEKLSGPATLPASQPVVKTTTTPRTDGGTVTTTTTTTTEPKLTYSDSKVTATDRTTTTTVINTCTGDGSCTTTSNTNAPDVEEKPAEESTDQCKLNPDSLACAEADTPEGEIPKSQADVTYTPEDPFGGGACPADLTASLGSIGRTVKVWDWQKTCSLALPLRALVLGLASFAAFLIVMPGKVDT